MFFFRDLGGASELFLFLGGGTLFLAFLVVALFVALFILLTICIHLFLGWWHDIAWQVTYCGRIVFSYENRTKVACHLRDRFL